MRVVRSELRRATKALSPSPVGWAPPVVPGKSLEDSIPRHIDPVGSNGEGISIIIAVASPQIGGLDEGCEVRTQEGNKGIVTISCRLGTPCGAGEIGGNRYPCHIDPVGSNGEGISIIIAVASPQVGGLDESGEVRTQEGNKGIVAISCLRAPPVVPGKSVEEVYPAT